VISGNTDGGVLITGAGTSTNLVEGNYVGTDVAGTGAVGNDGGVFILSGATGNTIGGTTAAARNVISGNGTGVLILDNSSTNNKVLGNFVGTNAGGTGALGNTVFGIGTDADRTTIQGNVVSGNGGDGIDLDTANASVVAGNLVGTTAGGTAAVPNAADGIKLLEGASGNTIGGTTAAERNVVSGNQVDGICLDGAGSANVVEGNYVGIGLTGGALGNGFEGICLRNGSSGNTIGGMTAAQRNVVSKNGENGILLASVDSNIVEGNYLGTNVAGTAALGNGGAGVFLSGSSFHNTIGGTAASTRNVISGNTSEGVLISGAAADDNFVEGNFIGTNAAGGGAVGNRRRRRDRRARRRQRHRRHDGGEPVNVISGNVGTGVEILDDGNVVEGKPDRHQRGRCSQASESVRRQSRRRRRDARRRHHGGQPKRRLGECAGRHSRHRGDHGRDARRRQLRRPQRGRLHELGNGEPESRSPAARPIRRFGGTVAGARERCLRKRR
jgi:titin